jgi:tRNA nucleotidyltransferase/poly(A) polymerase
MKFNKYYFEVPKITIKEDVIQDWKSYINRIPMLKTGIDVLNKIEQIGKDEKIENAQAYIVGGTIRDIVTGDKEPDDIDIATNVPIDILEKHFKTHDIGKNKDFGIIVINQDGFDFEIANFRSDGTYSDGRRPDSVDIVMTFEKDAERRDFTVNAMAVDKDGNVVDYFDGQGDIKNKIIRTVGDPEKRFEEDYIRMLRAVRFASRMGFTIDKKTMDAIKSNSSRIKNQAMERVMKEVNKMAQQSGGKFAEAIVMLKDSGMLQYILPEIIEMDNFEHSVQHHPEGNVLQHTLAALKSSQAVDPLINLGILFHDIGKIKTHHVDEKGMHRYFGHAEKANEMIDELSEKLKMDNKTKEALKFAAVNHMKFHDILKMKDATILKMMESPYFDLLISVAEADAKSRGNLFDQNEWDKIIEKIESLRKKYSGENSLGQLKKIVNGNLIISLLKINPKTDGPRIGEVLKRTMDYIINNNININDMNKIKDFIMTFK